MFWDDQCPARGPALTHVHSRRCGGEHFDDQCCECSRRWSTEVANKIAADVAPPFDVASRLIAMGLIDAEGVPVPTIKVFEFKDPDSIEPKMARGRCEGPVDAPGRGDLTDRQKGHLNFLRWRVAQGLAS